MVGETQARPFAQNTDDLIAMFKERRAEARQRVQDTKKMISELEIELASHSTAEMTWDAAIYELVHLGEHSGPKKKNRKEDEKEEEEGEEERV